MVRKVVRREAPRYRHRPRGHQKEHTENTTDAEQQRPISAPRNPPRGRRGKGYFMQSGKVINS